MTAAQPLPPPGPGLTEINRADLPVLKKWINDPEMMFYSGLWRPVPDVRHEKWFESITSDPNALVFGWRLPDGVLAGLVQLVNLIRAIGWQPKGGGQAEQLRELLPLLFKHLTLTAGEAQFVDNSPGAPELWANHTGNTARILETLCLAAPHNNLVAPLLRGLVNQSKDSSGHFGGTQNNVAALAALAAYARALEPEVMLPAAGQGILALEVRLDDARVLELIAPLTHPPTALALAAERGFLARLGTGCQLPVAALAVLNDGTMVLEGLIASLDGQLVVRGQKSQALNDPISATELGRSLAEELLARGGEDIMKAL